MSINRNDLTILAPGEGAFAITPNDSDFIPVTRGVYVGGSGTLHVIMAGGQEVTFTALAAGVVHPLRVIKVFATSTAATSILGIL
jgi:hypothetical protein